MKTNSIKVLALCGLVAGWVCGSFAAAPAEKFGAAALPELKAKWIWKAQGDVHAYNQTVLARTRVKLDHPHQAVLRITADSWYRLLINGQWINDGPCRSWPEHFQYDVLDVTPALVDGVNEIVVVARYFGVGDFHRVPKQAGLLAQLDVSLANGKTKTVVSDSSWEISDAPGWLANVPKTSIQMEPFEIYDARLEERVKFGKARELFEATQGPWRDLHARDVELLTRQPVAFKAFGGAKVVRCDGWNFCLPAARLMNPGAIEANHNGSCACGMATLLEATEDCVIELQSDSFKVAIDGKPATSKKQIKLARGPHLVLAMVKAVVGHEKEKSFRFMNPQGFKLVNPLDPKHENPWVFLPFKEYAFVTNDLIHNAFAADNRAVLDQVEAFAGTADKLLREVKTPAEFQAALGGRAQALSSAAMFVIDPTWQFQNRRVLGDAAGLVDQPAALMFNTPTLTTIRPSPEGDVELMYDLGAQDIGYWVLDLLAPAGVTLDIYAIEYITPEGKLQHTGAGYRNGMRYITREGINRFVSVKRRSGRYVFLTLRNQKAPVQIRNFSLVESTYPVNAVGDFNCSDARLDRIWDISTRTLKLCMEDTLTDCPLYEQTHWVGDARNESLMAYPVFGATDLGKRCIELTAQSLEHYPIAGCQTPSCWDVLLPAWSFLWGISTWDYYWHTGDQQFLREIYPAVIRNLKGAEKYVNDQGLFSGPFWNMFDWTGADQSQKTVIHNSMFMVGAIDAALKEAEVLHDQAQVAWLKQLRARMVAGINKLWDAQKHAYPDSVHADGSVSRSTCQHTSFLSILYDIVEAGNQEAAKQNLINPPKEMVRLGSPFAALYLFETLEKLGMEDKMIEEIYRNYLPMLETGATTVWESFASGTTGRGGFPTRSHCHAWSSAPSYFLNRIVLGIKPVAAGGRKFQVSPHLSGLSWARGTVSTVKGPVAVSWKLVDASTLEINCTAPDGVEIEFVKNASHDRRTITFNGKKVE